MRFAVPLAALTAVVALAGLVGCNLLTKQPHNVVIFVADGLRYGIVSPETAPALAAVQHEGVDFTNSHSMYPTITTPNASAIATGHRVGDTGDFGNTVYLGAPLPASYGSFIAAYEDDPTLGDADKRFGGNYLNEITLLAAARAQGFSTAAIGKVGPTAIQDVTARDGKSTIIVDDQTGYPEGLPLAPDVVAAMKAAGLGVIAADRGLNTDPGTYIMAGVHVPNKDQQDWFTAVATKVLLPRFKAANKPFVMVFWSRDPDGTQHNEGDSLNTLKPGINGPTTLAAIRNASDDLQRIRDTLKALGLDKTTDIVVTADHGFSTASKESATSPSAKRSYVDVPKGFLPPGFLAIDLAQALNLPMYDPAGLDIFLNEGAHSKSGNANLGKDTTKPEVVIGANGGSDLIWLPNGDAKANAAKIVAFLTTQDYTGAIFVDDKLGRFAGALPLSAIGVDGSALTPRPAIYVSFRSVAGDCGKPDVCGIEVADTNLQQGQGIHGTFGRADTRNFMAAAGPDFKAGFADPAPVSNADWAPTLAKALGLQMTPKGHNVGRVMDEAMAGGGSAPAAERFTVRSDPASSGFVTELHGQKLGDAPYFDTAGDPKRTLSLN